MSREAMKQALEALDFDKSALVDAAYREKQRMKAITALRQALEQPATDTDLINAGCRYVTPLLEQPADEPVAWRTFDGEGGYDYRSYDWNEQYRELYISRNGEKYASWVEPLYTRPQPAAQDEDWNDDLTKALFDRDQYHEMADALAAKIEEITGTKLGEHTSANCPWRNALDAADDWIASPQPAAQWVGLTQQDIDIAFDDTQEGGGFDEFARAIEAKLREKNGGDHG